MVEMDNWLPEELNSWSRLAAHDIDNQTHHLTFSKRLARDNDWTAARAVRVIYEYKRFCFLAMHAGHPVTPSDDVDQVWHLHLTYTREYWERFCPKVLGKLLHHGPTEGGETEEAKYHDWYSNTLESYSRFFGDPPSDIWPAIEQRFEDANQYVRVHRIEVITGDTFTARLHKHSACGTLLYIVMVLFFILFGFADWQIIMMSGFMFLVTVFAMYSDIVGRRLGRATSTDYRREGKRGVFGDGGGSDGGGCGSGCGGCGS